MSRNTQKHFPELKTAKNVFMKNRGGLWKLPSGQQRVKHAACGYPWPIQILKIWLKKSPPVFEI